MFGPRWAARLAALAIPFAMSGCGGSLDYGEAPQVGIARQPAIVINAVAGTASAEISVLVYNVAGLPWPFGCFKNSRTLDESGKPIPIACDRADALAEIGAALGELRRTGAAPDIVLLQEAFIAAAAEIPERGGYPNWVAGPSAAELGRPYSDRASPEFLAARSFWKGEMLGKHQSSGLVIASNFPIVEHINHPFNQWECAGFDCLANKGVSLVRIEIPGVPGRLVLVNTHLNSRRASGVFGERALDAHHLQVNEANEFLSENLRYKNPLIWGGDFNMRRADQRIEYFVERAGGAVNEVSSFCIEEKNNCEVRIEWDTDTPWYETQDLQGWLPGERVEVKPTRVAALFDRPKGKVMLSDHDGLLVYYRLTWPLED